MNDQRCADADVSTNASVSAKFLRVHGRMRDATLSVATDADGRTLKCPSKVVSCAMHVMHVLCKR